MVHGCNGDTSSDFDKFDAVPKSIEVGPTLVLSCLEANRAAFMTRLASSMSSMSSRVSWIHSSVPCGCDIEGIEIVASTLCGLDVKLEFALIWMDLGFMVNSPVYSF